jgi:hypothetical protein
VRYLLRLILGLIVLQIHHILPLFIVLIIIHAGIPLTSCKSISGGMSPLGLYGEERVYLDANAGEQVQLTYEASLYPIECALYVLQNYDWSIDLSLIDLASLARTYNHIGISGHLEFTASETSGFLLMALNTANVTQQFEYEWVCTVPGEELQVSGIIVMASVTPVLVCGICLLLLRRRHRQLLQRAPDGSEYDQDVF